MAECWCGALIRKPDDEEDWVDERGGTHCYPDAEHAADRDAKHAPVEDE